MAALSLAAMLPLVAAVKTLATEGATVGAGGGYSVSLAPAQTNGGTVTVTPSRGSPGSCR